MAQKSGFQFRFYFEDVENAKLSYRLTLATISNWHKKRSLVKTPAYNFALIVIRLVVLGRRREWRLISNIQKTQSIALEFKIYCERQTLNWARARTFNFSDNINQFSNKKWVVQMFLHWYPYKPRAISRENRRYRF